MHSTSGVYTRHVHILEQLPAKEYKWSSETLTPQVFHQKNKNQPLGIVV